MAADTMYIGINPTASGRPHALAVLDAGLRIEKLTKASFDDILAAITGYSVAVCGVDAPGAPCKGLLTDKDYRRKLGLDAGQERYNHYRVCEYELRRRRIAIYNAPREAKQAPSWMQEGWRFYEALRKAGFVEHPRSGAKRMFETFPHAAFTALAGRRPYGKSSMEGLLQRQMILFNEGVEVPDPMTQLEEWTSHRLITGQLPREDLLDHDRLDALMAAYTAYIVDREPGEITTVGDPVEGQIILPTMLNEKY